MDARLSKKSKVMEKLTPYLFISPWLIGFFAFTAGPLALSLVMSFYDWPVIGESTFVGLGNYIRMFTQDPQFWNSLGLTLKFAMIFDPLNMIIALVLAMLIATNVKGSNLFRVIFYIPSVVSGVAVAIIWGWILDSNNGILNYILSLVGIDGPLWLQDPKWAIVAIVIASAWGVGNMMLIFYTDIKSIPSSYYEAAVIDGATPLQQFFKITIPIITPTILFNLVTSTISALQQLTLVILLTGGGPMKSTYFYGLFVYENAFKHHRLGYASANAWVMFFIILGMTAVIFKSSSAWVFYENEVKKTKKAKRGK
ncbi:carbohydrate ABC transporter permease [Jeotgalibaca porci]|uniref:carbohydrate ABC transporter permease n=1 Tax=Jeotgalibaca porci TaxID=1868793 RepID=UPI00359FD927